ncbi:hypothetical protein L2E82_28872 [Cichorium intybus]|uniref:Uncharacterized protein n=1 Tax=Cichorium intybus TaxID=13427 RepID=A0ACB9CXC2_CICIN|nr:hypothetical protein L2E82_28872 [Cichorium intybus]
MRQLAPDWLPFVPSSSYWVSSLCHRPESHGLVEVLNQLTNPLTEDESMSDPFKSHLSFSFMVLLRIIKQNSKEDLLTKHPIAVSEFLTSNYNEMFMNMLLFLQNVQDESAKKILSDVDGPTKEVVDVVVIEYLNDVKDQELMEMQN